MNYYDSEKKFYIATSIVYASSIPHIGNIYEIILADVVARFKKMEGYSVYFQTGTDEHGQKIERKANHKGIPTKIYVDQISQQIKEIYSQMNIQYDFFVKTSDLFHKIKVQNIVNQLKKQNDIYLGVYEGWYSVNEESYISEKDLINGKTVHGEIPIWEKEKVYFFKLSRYKKRLLQYLNHDPDLVLPHSIKKEILNLLDKPLIDLCISRTSLKWGINFQFDPEHTVYVWIDALCNYITGLEYYSQKNNYSFQAFWPCDLHIIGKDISKFHLIYYPILLMALNLPLPKKFLIHPWILFNDKKMSKSLNNVIYVSDLLKIFPVDAIRYFVLNEIPYNSDGILTYDLLFERYNKDLVNTLGNLISRTLGMIVKYKKNHLKKIYPSKETFKISEMIDLEKKSLETFSLVKKYMKYYRIGDSLKSIFKLAHLCNKYIDLKKPWELFKKPEDSDKLDSTLYNLVETIRFIGVLLQSFLPETSKNILEQIKSEENTFKSLEYFGITQNKELKLEKKLFTRLNKEDFFKKNI
ncbi:MAG: methionine--tRNA ligase [Candidatus Phytoplasma stylosanthis]|uniref:methionine--tRNA ligase n=1 Tax=Candidatus Phytoplasma stylosanthis TaxID=2798314 RepID=UPI00293A1997|nr:methionine--tRNA ligase [Candidatus Phytoplasma stylosanthis]MDV3167873.1 methionine--tRNA ligase [Candidatus Phytoplasma stylosanthis]MDV3170851.1 methionine--tRNA ligase [Candidatus Phytoplasma stylosanthis]MDV3173523.1 methionine--tRNA ligase [Candidatus Phytoplasma stylosanthis]MDV3174031.1 methionine--tRNA ligase [Candidatus Phytoplasma stylosanthis]MDV3202457.1 methionine--tRNA ligase [Candidatus Phytoplasma stylosanthis]